jgi:hypothetical protein
MEAQEFERSGGVQGALIFGVVTGIIVAVLAAMLLPPIPMVKGIIVIGLAGGAGGFVYNRLRDIAESRRR